MNRVGKPHRSIVRAAGVAGVLLFLGLVGRFWHPVYGFTAFLQLDSSNDATKIGAFRETPVYVYRDTGGYDGLFYAQIAYHPALDSPELAPAVDGLAYRARRILLPALAWAAALGRPAWIVHADSVLNVAAWLALAALLWKLLAVRDGRGWLAWFGVLFSAGALGSVRLALPDLVALSILAAAILLLERGRLRSSLAGLAAAGLARETSLLALPGFWERPWLSRRNLLACAAAIAPLALWIAYVRWRVGPGGAGARNFGWPLTGLAGKWIATLAAFRTEGDRRLVLTTLLATVALTAQAAYLLVEAKLDDRWWRIGAAYAALLLVLGEAVWEGHPGAATRVLLPMTLAFNVLAVRRRASLLWLLAGNLAVAAGLLSMKDVPRDPAEIAAVRSGGAACIARLGEGWYGRENGGGRSWAWSRGRATILFEAWPRTRSAARFEFALNSLSPRRVVLRSGGQELWRGEIASAPTARQSVPVPIGNGRATLEFATDAPPVREGPGADARLLGFALNDPRLVVAIR
jgi:hypothetical protein